MPLARRWLLGVALLPLLAAAGCQWVQRGQLTACEVKSRSLNEQNQAQLAEIANLKEHCRQVEDQLSRTEAELARLQSGGDTQATRQR